MMVGRHDADEYTRIATHHYFDGRERSSVPLGSHT